MTLLHSVCSHNHGILNLEKDQKKVGKGNQGYPWLTLTQSKERCAFLRRLNFKRNFWIICKTFRHRIKLRKNLCMFSEISFSLQGKFAVFNYTNISFSLFFTKCLSLCGKQNISRSILFVENN